MIPRAVFLGSTNPYWNLAFEEYLFNTFDEESGVLLLYVNRQAVVIGKHQNPWLEVNLSELQTRGVDLVRRISGGGTVYHDEGNLNFSFLSAKNGFDRKRNLLFVQHVLRSIGIPADITDTADLYLGSGKISGNAFCFRRNRALHHGTLLIGADLSRLRELLAPAQLSIETHAVTSQSAATVNICSVKPEITCETLAAELAKAYLEGSGVIETVRPEDANQAEVQDLSERNRSWEWVYGRTPEFRLSVGRQIVTIRKGQIRWIAGESPPDFDPEPLIGVALRKPDLSRFFGRIPAENEAIVRQLHSMTV